MQVDVHKAQLAMTERPTIWRFVQAWGDAFEQHCTTDEQKGASPEQLLIRKVNLSYYCFSSDSLFEDLGRVSGSNWQGRILPDQRANPAPSGEELRLRG